MVRRGDDLSPLMRDIGEELLNSTRERFRAEVAPDGSPWAPLSPATRRRKRRNADKVLTESGDLGRYITVRATRDSVEIGSTRIYAGAHQFGTRRGQYGADRAGRPIPWGDIPARPFLGLSSDDLRRIRERVADYITRPFRRS